MPGYLTHLLFGRHTVHNLKKLSLASGLKEAIFTYPGAFHIGTQGPDLFFYELKDNLNPRRALGSTMHHTKTDEYFRACLDFLGKPNSAETKEIFASYFAGLICHYTLDCIAHPFIYWHTDYKVNTSGGLGYLATHCQYESNIDSLMLQRLKHCLPSDYNGARFIKLTKNESAMLGKGLSETITTTYFPDNPSAYTTPSFMKHALYSMSKKVALLTDHGGPKRKIVETIELLTARVHFLTCLFSVDDVDGTKDFLNEKNAVWKNPWDLSLESSDSFLKLYQDALLIAADRLRELACYYNSLMVSSSVYDKRNQYRQTLLNSLSDLSYNTGQSWPLY
ncbi:MAG: zinc dependent phospholipase C family protein [bacterium]|nr:zinc dependent phospholipase C family protein [bacterium]